MPGPTEYRVLLRGLKDESEEGRSRFLQRFGEAYKMSADQAAQWLRAKKGVIYTVKTPEAAEKAARYLESLGGIAAVEKIGVEPAPAPPEVPAEPASIAASPAPPPPAPAPVASTPPEVPAGDASAPTAPAPPPPPRPVAPASSGAPLRACPHCTFPYRTDQPVCPACKRPPTYAQAGTSPGAAGTGPAASQSYDLSAIVKVTIDTYKNNFVTLFVLSLLPVAVFMFLGLIVGVGAALFAALGKDALIPLVAAAVMAAAVLLPLTLYLTYYLWSAMVAAIDVAIRGERPEVVAIIKAVPPMLPLQALVNSLGSGFLMLGAIAPFLALVVYAATQKQAGLAALGAVPMFPVAVVVGVLLMFVMPVTVLESKWFVEALRRSIELGRGYYLRNFGIMFLIVFAVAIVTGIIGTIFNFIPIIGPMFSSVIQAAAGPLTTIPLVLLYYDMRMKKGLD